MEARDDVRGKDQFISFGSEHLRKIIEKSVSLSEFMRMYDRHQGLSKDERLSIIAQALVLLDMNYVHLPLKRAMHAADPIQRLKLLKFRFAEMSERQMPSELHFHQRMLEIFTSARDIHTMYLLPAPFNEMVAYLPFVIEEYFDRKKQKFLVSRVIDKYYEGLRSRGPEFDNFEPGVEVLYWNGIPIARAIEINGEKQAGSNIEARFARGLDSFTIRPLSTSLPPDEMWVAVTYRSKSGKEFTLPQEWMVFSPRAVAGSRRLAEAEGKHLSVPHQATSRRAVDYKRIEINRVMKMLYPKRSDSERVESFREAIKTSLPELRAERVRLYGKEFGYLRIFTFETTPERLVNGIARILKSKSFPQEGLILDVRGNGGGQIDAGERLLQLFTPRRIRPELFEFINTPLNLQICRNAPKSWGLSQWAKSIADSVMTNATYSSGFPITSEAACNDIGQVYYGPVVLITDALSYSTTDLFAAGFQDNGVGTILGTSGNTGAGGANVWPLGSLIFALGEHENGPFAPLPKGARMRVAMRRSIRVGKHAGRPLEELGIVPDRRHHMTRDDLLNNNIDLLKKAAKILLAKPAYRLVLTLRPHQRQSQILTLSTKNISRVDILLNDRPLKTVDTADGTRRAGTIVRQGQKKRSVLVLNGYDASNHLVARRKQIVQW